jgi:hypothetical protein
MYRFFLMFVVGDEVEWVQCDVCQCWFHFRCIGLASISEHEEYVCTRCKQCQSASVNEDETDDSAKAAVDGTVALCRPFGVLSESETNETSDEDDDDNEDDDPIRDFYASESIDNYIIRSKNDSFVKCASAQTSQLEEEGLSE